MKCYILVHVSLQERIITAIKEDFIKYLTKFYGDIRIEDISLIVSNTKAVSVYIMDSSKYEGYNTVISDTVKKIIKNYIHISDISVNLNYALFDPHFNPEESKNVNKHATSSEKNVTIEEYDYEKLSNHYHAETPKYNFDQVILPSETLNQILEAIAVIEVENIVFDQWGLRSIIPNASSCLGFYGPPGTGKTMAAEAVADKLGKKILRATYADIESKYHGEGPKMVKAIFRAATRDDAVLFIDESDSLLSKRLTNVTDGSAQAINSMRSQLLISLEQFKGIVIFATNLAVNYDKAFLSRLINIRFDLPDTYARECIWKRHLNGHGLNIPLSKDISYEELANNYLFCGRDIRNAVKDACISVALRNGGLVCQEDLIKAAEKTKQENDKIANAQDYTSTNSLKITGEAGEEIKKIMQDRINRSGNSISKDHL